MVVEFEIPPQDLSKMNTELLRTAIKPKATTIRLLFLGVGILCIGLIVLWSRTGVMGKPATMLCIVSAYLMFLASVFGINVSRALVIRKVAKNPVSGCRESIRILPSRIDHFNAKANSACSWTSVKALLKSKSYFFVTYNNNTCVPIPLSAFDDDRQISEFQRLVESYISGKSDPFPLGTEDVAVKPVAWPPPPTAKHIEEHPDLPDEPGTLPVLGTQVDPSKAVKLNYNYNGQDVLKFNYRFRSSIMWRDIIIRTLQPLAMGTFLVPLFAASSVTAASISIAAAAVVLAGYTIGKVNKQIRSSVDSRPTEALTLEIETDFVRLVTRTESTCANYACSGFTSVESGPEGVCIFLGYERFIPIPVRSFPDKSAAQDFYEQLKLVAA